MDKLTVDMKPEFVERFKQEFGYDIEDEWDELLFDFEKLSYFDRYSMNAMLTYYELQFLKDGNSDSIMIPVSVELIDKVLDILRFIDDLKLIKVEEEQ